MFYLAPFHLELIVDARREIMDDDHLAIWRKTIFFLNSNSYKGFYAGTAGYATWGHGCSRAHPNASSKSIFAVQIEVVNTSCSGFFSKTLFRNI